jgi:four helix bundle protein
MMGGMGSRGEEYDAYVEGMKARTKAFALRVIKVCQSLPRDFFSNMIGGQLLRAGTSVGANYRAACRVRTPKEFTAKIRIVMEEADESHFWLELLAESGIMPVSKLASLTGEAYELVAIFTAAHATAAAKSKPARRR